MASLAIWGAQSKGDDIYQWGGGAGDGGDGSNGGEVETHAGGGESSHSIVVQQSDDNDEGSDSEQRSYYGFEDAFTETEDEDDEYLKETSGAQYNSSSSSTQSASTAPIAPRDPMALSASNLESTTALLPPPADNITVDGHPLGGDIVDTSGHRVGSVVFSKAILEVIAELSAAKNLEATANASISPSNGEIFMALDRLTAEVDRLRKAAEEISQIAGSQGGQTGGGDVSFISGDQNGVPDAREEFTKFPKILAERMESLGATAMDSARQLGGRLRNTMNSVRWKTDALFFGGKHVVDDDDDGDLTIDNGKEKEINVY